MSYIRFENINKSFGSLQVLNNINLEIEKGQFVTLLGASGCGKTTLLRCLAGLETVGSGSIYLDDKDITAVSPRQRGIGMVFQQYSLFPNMKVHQNVAFGLERQKMDKALIKAKVDEMLEIVNLADQREKYPAQLSGGQQQRVALARALVTQPKVLLLDEPLSAIDALLRKNLQVEIRRIQRELRTTTVFVTHDQEEAMVISDMIHLMEGGRIIQSAPPMELYANPATRFAASFIGNYNMLSAAEFAAAFGQDPCCEVVAFRPELVLVQPEAEAEPPDSEHYSASGVLTAGMPHGNFLRYTMDCRGVHLFADYLSDAVALIPEGSAVRCLLPKNAILKY